ncbi:MAG: hypothetical protein MN733_26885 [Nitrososphaera sp.]|nr:hypothetical protein [Nitrososphaera sp.]
MNIDPQVASALIGTITVLASALVSYVISKRLENSKSTIEYLKSKISALEEKKKLLSEVNFQQLGEDITKENLIDKLAQSRRRSFSFCAQTLKHIDHYLPPAVVETLDRRIEPITLALGAEAMEDLAGREIPKEMIGDVLRGEALRNEMNNVIDAIIQAVNSELRMSIADVEKLSGLGKK